MILKKLDHKFGYHFRRKAWYHGIEIAHDPAIISPKIWKRVCRGRYETREIAAAQAMVGAGDRVLELGAGLGLVSAILSKTRPVEKILAIEANPELADFIVDLWKRNGIENADLRSGVMSREADKTVDFFLRRDFWSSSMEAGSGKYEKRVEVSSWNVTTLVESFEPSVLIVDIEGGEAELFGEAGWLAGVRTIMMELHPDRIGIAAVKGIFDALSTEGFAYHAGCSTGKVVTFLRVDRQ